MKIYSNQTYPKIYLAEDGKFWKDLYFKVDPIDTQTFLTNIPINELIAWKESLEKNEKEMSINQIKILTTIKKLMGGGKKWF